MFRYGMVTLTSLVGAEFKVIVGKPIVKVSPTTLVA